MIPPDFVAYIRPLSTTEDEPRWGHRNGFTPEFACRSVAKNAGINIAGFIEENQDGNKTLVELINNITFGRMYDEIVFPYGLLILEWSMLSPQIKQILFKCVVPIVIVDEVLDKLINLDEACEMICPTLREGKLRLMGALADAADRPERCPIFQKVKAGGEHEVTGKIDCVVRWEGGVCPDNPGFEDYLKRVEDEEGAFKLQNRHYLAVNFIKTVRRLEKSAGTNRDAHTERVLSHRRLAYEHAISIIKEGNVSMLKEVFRILERKFGIFSTPPTDERKLRKPFDHGEWKRLLESLEKEEEFDSIWNKAKADRT
ncbi:protein of unknown function [Magnetospirillum sp. XM-1]|uniref:hypothetical protein n=1 Tax=Magnetospirillum sp. XM-1 TaxID=1663591 RepID=UPI00073DD4B6|nr:hypothetical protein [Magnetospirillum sp. XM-1]CUW39896.1 protein of unknown function [Magnetospirillum sp. XM-1]